MQPMRIVVLGFLIREPTGGLAWHYLNYVLGLVELGHDVYYIEDSSDSPMGFSPRLASYVPTSDPTSGLSFADQTFRRVEMADRWAYFDAHTNQWHGPRAHDARETCQSADVLVHVSGWNPIRDWLSRVPIRILIDTDPGFTQLRNLTDRDFRNRTEAHTSFFSFGKPSSPILDDGIVW